MADYEYVQSTGVILPDTADTLADVQNEWRAAFGDDLLVTTDTPQGVLIAAETEARDAVARNNAKLANQINPDLAGGVFLDAIMALTFDSRTKATRTLVPNVLLAGVAGTIIPAGVQLRYGEELFASVGQVVLGANGQASVGFAAVNTGPVTVPVGQLTQIETGILGWETATNPFTATIGVAEESDVAARARRRKTLGRNGLSLVGSIVGSLYALDGVDSLVFRENKTSSTQTIDGVSLKPHSVYVVVQGGRDQDIAETLLETVTLGAGFNGAVTVQVVEPSSGQTYTVAFDRPTLVPIFAKFTVRVNAASVDPQDSIRRAVIDYAAGRINGEDGFEVGSDVSPFELAGAVTVEVPGVYVQKVELSTDGVNYSAAEVPISIQQLATITSAAITVNSL